MVFLIIQQKFKTSNVTQYLIHEGFNVIGKVTLLADADISSLVEPPNGVWLQV